MKIMVIGSGGREHAIIKSLCKSPKIDEIYCLPGNGGIANDATCVDIAPTDIDNIVKFAISEKIDYAVVAMDDPLALGCVDSLNDQGISCFGPQANAAIIESSKVFAKNLMKKYGIPTAEYKVFTDAEDALAYIDNCPLPTVIKADGLALGKGVIIAQTKDEAKDAIKEIMEDKKFGESGNNIVIEEFLEGPEVSVLSFTDGKTIVPMVSSMDHKRAKDGDEGLNTGGMGCIAPNPYYTQDIAQECLDRIINPTIKAMEAEGRTFKGCLYFGLMVTKDGPKVIEYNCRFGDPEAQVVLPLLESDLLEIMKACTNGTLTEDLVKFSCKNSCCVVAASEGYPESYEKGFPILVDDTVKESVYYAGAKAEDGNLLTNGGRVLGVTAVEDSLIDAINKAYKMLEKVEFNNKYYRRDIGKRAILKSEISELN